MNQVQDFFSLSWSLKTSGDFLFKNTVNVRSYWWKVTWGAARNAGFTASFQCHSQLQWGLSLLNVVSPHLPQWIVHRCLEFLLQNDANPSIQDKEGYNTVHYAAAYGHRQCLELVSLALLILNVHVPGMWAPLTATIALLWIIRNLWKPAKGAVNICTQMYVKSMFISIVKSYSTTWCLRVDLEWSLCMQN